jgi:anaerobic magnesium-protoporphyrin IX monomethyl ester cyclase
MDRKLKILLLHPGHQDTVEVAIHKRFLRRDFIYPPLGVLSLAAWLRRHRPQWDVRVIDLQLTNDGPGMLRAALDAFKPHVAGLTIYTNQLLAGLQACRIIKSHAPGTHVVVGGPHLNLYPREMLQFQTVDFGVVGEGEEVLGALLDGLAAGRCRPESIKGLVWRRDGEVVQNAPAPFIADLDALIHPARHLLPVRKYRMLTGRRPFSTTAMTSRGCPYRCTFCDVPKSKVRFHSPEWVVEDVKSCLSQGIREVHFFDDMFNANPDRVSKIVQAFIRQGLHFDWSFRGRVDRLDAAMLRHAKKAGCYRVYLGLESGSDRTLTAMRKGFGVDAIRRGVKRAREAGLEIHGYFMLGFPGETRAEMQATVELACTLDLDFVQFSVTTYLPGTEIYRTALQQGVLTGDCWREQARAPRPDFKAPVAAAHTIGEEAVWRLVEDAYRRFYLRPKLVWRHLQSIRSPRIFLRRLWGSRLCLFPHA